MKQLILAMLALVPVVCAAAVEDLTTWTEEDPDADLTVTSTTITIASLNATYSNQDYVYKDQGEDFYSGDFTFRAGPINLTNSRVIALGVGAELPNEFTVVAGSLDVIWVHDGSTETLALAEFDNENEGSTESATTQDTYSGPAIEEGTDFWVELSRTSGSASLKVYSDAFSTLVDTLTITLSEAPLAYRYVYAPAKASNGSGSTVAGSIQNIDLAPGGGASTAVPVFMHHYNQMRN